MDFKREENYKLNGFDSWVHFLDFDVDKGDNTEYHYHEYIEILYFKEGAGRIKINGATTDFTPFTLAVISSQRAHAVDILKPTKYICIKIMPDILSRGHFGNDFSYVLPFVSETENGYFFSPEETASLEILPLIERISKEWTKMEYGFELAIKSAVLELFSKILRHLKSTNSLTKPESISPDMKKAIEYINQNFSTVTENQIAEFCHLSRNHFSFLFKKTFGKTYKDYLFDVKILQAEKMLLSTDKSITQIAFETGFSSASHFIDNFKSKNGITPAKFRKIK